MKAVLFFPVQCTAMIYLIYLFKVELFVLKYRLKFMVKMKVHDE